MTTEAKTTIDALLADIAETCKEVEEAGRLACLAAELPEQQEGEKCPVHMVLLVQTGCPHCRRARETYKDLLSVGKLREVNVISVEGQRIMNSGGPKWMPALLLADCNGKFILDLEA